MSFMGKVGFAVAASVLAAGSVLGAGSANAAGDEWGAMALDAGWTEMGRSINFPTRAEAEAAAIEECGVQDCAVQVSWSNGCLVLVDNEESAAWGTGATRAEAERNAYLALTEGTPQNLLVNVGSSQLAGGRVFDTLCTNNAS